MNAVKNEFHEIFKIIDTLGKLWAKKILQKFGSCFIPDFITPVLISSEIV